MSPVLYVFRLAWPFLKEMLLGGLSLKEGMKSAKKKVFLLFFISGLIILTLWIVPSFYKLSQEHLTLIKSTEVTNVQRLEARIKELEDLPKPEVVVVSNPPLPTTPPETLKETLKVVTKEEKPPVVKKKPNQVKSKIPQQVEPDARKRSYMDFFDKLDN